MATSLPNSPLPALVMDASIAVAIAAKEIPVETKVNEEVNRYLTLGYAFFAPGVIVSEVLYVLCGKLHDGTLTPQTHTQAVQGFHKLTGLLLPSPQGDFALVLRGEAIRGSYTCRRSADGPYIALAEQLTQTRPTTLLTLDADMVKQAAKNAPSVNCSKLFLNGEQAKHQSLPARRHGRRHLPVNYHLQGQIHNDKNNLARFLVGSGPGYCFRHNAE